MSAELPWVVFLKLKEYWGEAGRVVTHGRLFSAPVLVPSWPPFAWWSTRPNSRLDSYIVESKGGLIHQLSCSPSFPFIKFIPYNNPYGVILSHLKSLPVARLVILQSPLLYTFSLRRVTLSRMPHQCQDSWRNTAALETWRDVLTCHANGRSKSKPGSIPIPTLVDDDNVTQHDKAEVLPAPTSVAISHVHLSIILIIWVSWREAWELSGCSEKMQTNRLYQNVEPLVLRGISPGFLSHSWEVV